MRTDVTPTALTRGTEDPYRGTPEGNGSATCPAPTRPAAVEGTTAGSVYLPHPGARRARRGDSCKKDCQSMPMLFDAFDRIWIVNLESRPDRRREMEHQLSLVGLLDDPRVQFFNAIHTANPGQFRRAGSHGAFLSHMALLQKAAEADESILILQDDCDFLFPAIDRYRLPSRWDIFYGGYNASDPDNLEDSDIIGAHFMGFSRAAAAAALDYLIGLYRYPDFPPDPRASREPGFDPAIRPPIDGALVWFRRAHPEMKTVFAMLSQQRASRTDIGDQRWFDRFPGLRELSEAARRFKRRLARKPAPMTAEIVAFPRG